MHIMIDLETMGTRPSAPIIAIGAVAFDHRIVRDEFYVNVDLQSAVTAGATIDPGTVMWWLQRSDEAREALASGQTVDIVTALDKFDEWFDGVRQSHGEIKGVWGNGASFDNAILTETYKRLGFNPPWEFFKDRCYRTIKSVFPSVKIARSGTHHNALHDARTQAQHLIEISDEAGSFL